MKKNDKRQELIDIYGISCVLQNGAPVQVAPAVAEVPSAPVENVSWERLRLELKDCKKCILSTTRQNIVFGEGNEKSPLLFIGEGPGADEDAQGRPFVGKAGQLLTKMIEAMGYSRSDVYIANVVKCRPPQNREPFKDEVDACISFLHKQIRLINPKVIVCLGGTAAVHLLNTGLKITHMRGKFQDYNGIRVMPTFHPAYLLRNESKKRDVWNDLKMVMAELGKEQSQ